MSKQQQEQIRDAYRWAKDGCPHFHKQKGRKNKEIPRNCEHDVSCLNVFTMQSLPAISNWPPLRLQRCIVGPEPPRGPAEAGEELIPSGIKNLGNTCYANSVLQCMNRVGMSRRFNSNNTSDNNSNNANNDSDNKCNLNPRFLDFFLSEYKEEEKERSESVRERSVDDAEENPAANPLRNFFSKLRLTNGDSLDLTSVTKGLELDVGIQQDAQEFYALLVEMISHTSIIAAGAIRSQLTGQGLSITTCLSCNKHIERGENIGTGGIQVALTSNLQESIHRYLHAELSDSTFNCEQCGDTKAKFTSGYKFTKLPPIVCFHLLRFRYDPQKQTRVKVTNKIDLPEYLDLAAITSCSSASSSSSSSSGSTVLKNQNQNQNNNSSSKVGLYKLQCAVLHKGASALRGHYVSVVRSCSNEQKEEEDTFYFCDDDSVRKMKFSPFSPQYAEQSKKKGHHNNKNNKDPAKGGNPNDNNNVDPDSKNGLPPGCQPAMSRKDRRRQRQNTSTSSNKNENSDHDDVAIVAVDNNNKEAETSTNNISASRTWSSDDAFLVWYVRVEEEEEHENDNTNTNNRNSSPQKNENADQEDEDDAAAVSSQKKKKNNNKKKSTTTTNDNDDVDNNVIDADDAEVLEMKSKNQSLINTLQVPETFWSTLLRQTFVDAAEAKKLRGEYEKRVTDSKSIFQAWRTAGEFLSRNSADKFWANLSDRPEDSLVAVPEEWLQQIHAGAVRDGEFNEADTEVDISCGDNLFTNQSFEKLICHSHSSTSSSSSSKNQQQNQQQNQNQQQQHLLPLSPYRLVPQEFWIAISELRECILKNSNRNPSSSSFSFAQAVSASSSNTPSSSSRTNNNNNNMNITPLLLPQNSCESCVKKRMEDISSNREALEEVQKMCKEAKMYEGKPVDVIAKATSKGAIAQHSAGETVSPPYYVSPCVFESLLQVGDSNNATKAANLSFAGQDLAEGLVCEHGRLSVAKATKIVPNHVYQFLISKGCIASVDMPIWSISDSNNSNNNENNHNTSSSSTNNSTNNNKTSSSSTGGKKNNKKNQQQQQAEEEEEVDEDALLLLGNNNDNDEENDGNNSIAINYSCEDCENKSRAETAEKHGEKMKRQDERHKLWQFLGNDKINETIISENLKTKITSHRKSWKQQEKKRIDSIIAEKAAAEKAAADAQARGFQFVRGAARGGGGRGGGRGGGGQQQNQNQNDAATTPGGRGRGNNRNNAIEINEDAASSTDNKNKEKAKDEDEKNEQEQEQEEDSELVEKPVPPRIVKFALLPEHFVKTWRQYIDDKKLTMNRPEFFQQEQQQQQVQVEEEEEDNSHNKNKNKNNNDKRIPTATLRCEHNLSAIDLEDLKPSTKAVVAAAAAAAAASGGSSHKNIPAYIIKLEVLQIMMDKLETPYFDSMEELFGDENDGVNKQQQKEEEGDNNEEDDASASSKKRNNNKNSPRGGNNTNNNKKKENEQEEEEKTTTTTRANVQQPFPPLVFYVQDDENIRLEPSPCEICISARRAAYEHDSTVFSDGVVEVAGVIPISKRQKAKQTFDVEGLSSDMTPNQLYELVEATLKRDYLVTTNKPNGFILRKKGGSIPIPRIGGDNDGDDAAHSNKTIIDFGIRNRGVCLAIEPSDSYCEFIKIKAKDQENEDMEHAIRMSLNQQEIELEQEEINNSYHVDPNAIDSEDIPLVDVIAAGEKKQNKKSTATAAKEGAAFESSNLGGGGNSKKTNKGSKHGGGNKGVKVSLGQPTEVNCPACTFLNSSLMTKCEICGTPL